MDVRTGSPNSRVMARHSAADGAEARVQRGGGAQTAHGARSRRQWRRRVLAGALVIVFLFTVATARLIVWPAAGMPARVDAIVMPAGPGDRLSATLRLAIEQTAPVLVVSQGHLGYGGPCPPATAAPKAKIICFQPDPANTRGEMEYTARLAKRYGWRSVVLVTTREQDTRARLLLERCYGGSVYVVTVAQQWYEWPYQILYGWGALFKAVFLQRSC